MAHWKINYSDIQFGEKIGEGNFGAVYKGSHLGTPAAIKKLFYVEDNFMQKYIEREMDTLTSLHHPNIVQLMGICIEGDDVYIVTEFVTGGDLRSRLKRVDEYPMDWPLKVHCAKELALALTYLHSKNIIHRDLKSHNLLVGDNWKIKVCDFGLARSEGKPGTGMTIVGTDDWMAPEVAVGASYDRSCDVFSFGIVLFEIIARKKPLQREMKDRFSFVEDNFKPLTPEDTPEKLWQLVLDCTQLDPKSRPSIKQAVDRLDEIQKEIGPPDFSGKKKKKPKKPKEPEAKAPEPKKAAPAATKTAAAPKAAPAKTTAAPARPADTKKASPAKPADAKKAAPAKPADTKKAPPAKPADTKKAAPAKPAEVKKSAPATTKTTAATKTTTPAKTPTKLAASAPTKTTPTKTTTPAKTTTATATKKVVVTKKK